jgi:carbon monoxide dehydrogenase subunit G
VKLVGRHHLAFPRQVVWDALLDPAVLSRTLPGCESLERTGEGAFRGRLKVQVGPVRGDFEGTLELTDLAPPESYRMSLQGEGPSGFMTGAGTVRLAEVEGGTDVHYDLDAQVGGRIAGVGQRLLDSSARVITRQGLEGLERQLAARRAAVLAAEGAPPETVVAAAAAGDDAAGAAPPAATGPAPAPAAAEGPPAPSQGEFAVRFARGLWQEMVPAPARPWVVAGGLAVLALAVVLVARACAG